MEVVYLTNHDSELDQFYYSKLSLIASRAAYVREPFQPFGILASLRSTREILDFTGRTTYAKVLLASIDNFAFGMVLKDPSVEIVTFDDGAANIMKPGIYDTDMRFRDHLYRKLARVPTPKEIYARLSRHYTIYEGVENIVSADKLRFVEVFKAGSEEQRPGESVFFIGQPFHEYLNPAELDKLRDHANGLKIDYYVQHPRESARLLPSVPVLDTTRSLGEHAILRTASGTTPVVYACFSSLLLNLHPSLARKTYLSVSRSALEENRVHLAVRTGCQVVRL